jgi:uncharacterized membrane protein
MEGKNVRLLVAGGGDIEGHKSRCVELGIADKVAPQLRKLYPHAIPQIQNYDRYIRYTTSYNAVLYRSYSREMAAKQKARSRGSGGRASFGGGGGFSGGGRGGSR